MKKNYILSLCLMLVFIYPTISDAYLPELTHPLINGQALIQSGVDDFMKYQMGFINGIEQKVKGYRVWQWIQQGGTDEDGNIRGLYHFHDPKQSWDYAGIHVGILGPAFSSLGWAQDRTVGSVPTCADLSEVGIPCPAPPPTSNPNRSWPGARKYFYEALTSSDPNTREQNFADAFKYIGHVMHLLADAAVPEHVRNDEHLFGGSRYEQWAESFGINSGSLSSFIEQNSTLNPADYSVITNISLVDGYVPISNFWDSTPAAGYGGTLIGLAEYTNYNFLSPHTVFENYTYPFNPQLTNQQALVGEIVKGEDGNYDNKLYYSGTTSDNKSIRHLVSTGYLWSDLKNVSAQSMNSAKFILDDLCYNDYASILVPKAVSYNAALLDYFFRGTLEVSPPDRCLYGLVDGAGDQKFKKIKAKVKNTTLNETLGVGTLTAVARYKKRTDYQPDLSTDPPKAASDDPPIVATVEPDFSYSVSAPITLSTADVTELNAVRKEFEFDFTASPIPPGITDLYLHVVFKGTLGNEIDNAVAVGMADLSEPTHFNIWNTTDYWYSPTTGALTASEEAYKVTLITKVSFCNSVESWPPAPGDDSVFNAQYSPMQPGQFARLITISEPGTSVYFVIRFLSDSNVYLGDSWNIYFGMVYQDGIYSDPNNRQFKFRGKTANYPAGYAKYYNSDPGLWLAPWPEVTYEAIPAYNFNW